VFCVEKRQLHKSWHTFDNISIEAKTTQLDDLGMIVFSPTYFTSPTVKTSRRAELILVSVLFTYLVNLFDCILSLFSFHIEIT